MSQPRKKRLLGGVLAGLAALVATIALATPALAASSVQRGNLLFTATTGDVSNISGEDVANSKGVGQIVTISGGSANITVTTASPISNGNTVTGIVLAGSYSGTLTLDGVEISGTPADGGSGVKGSAAIALGTGGSANSFTGTPTIIINNSELTGGHDVGTGASSSYPAIDITNGLSNTAASVSFQICDSILTGGTGTGTSQPAILSSATGVDDYACSVTFDGTNTVSAVTGSSGVAAISIAGSSAGEATITFNSGTTTIVGGDEAVATNGSLGAVDVADGNVLNVVTNVATTINGTNGDGTNAGIPALSLGAKSELNITGSAALTLVGGNGSYAGAGLVTADAFDSTITIGDGDAAGTLIATGGNSLAQSNPGASGMYVQGSATASTISLENGSLTLNGGTGFNNGTEAQAATPGGAGLSVGGTTPKVNIVVSGGTLTANGGKGGNGTSTQPGGTGGNGIDLVSTATGTGGITLEDGSIVAVAGNAGTSTGVPAAGGNAIVAGDLVSVEAGSMTVTGGNANSGAGTEQPGGIGLDANAGLEISGGTITAKGGNGSGQSDGAFANNKGGAAIDVDGAAVVISGGTVSATGGVGGANTNTTATQGGTGGIGFNSAQGVTVSNATLTATGGAGGASTNGQGGTGGAGTVIAATGLTMTSGTATITGGAGGKGATAATASDQGNGLQTAGLTLSNGTKTNGQGPDITVAGNVALTGAAGSGNVTPVVNGGNRDRSSFYPWLAQVSANASGAPASLYDFNHGSAFGEFNSTTYDYLNIAPHPLSGVGMGVAHANAITSTATEPAAAANSVATYVVAETKAPTVASLATHQYKISFSATFEGVSNLIVSPTSAGGTFLSNLVSTSNGSITPAANITWIDQSNSVFYVNPTATGNTLALNGTVSVENALSTLYPDLQVNSATNVPVVYTINLLPGKTTAGGNQCTFTVLDGNPNGLSDQTSATIYTAADGSGQVVNEIGLVSSSALKQLPSGAKTQLPYLTTTGSTVLLGWFNETVDPYELIPITQVSGWNANATLTAECGTVTLNKVSPTPVNLPQGQSQVVSAQYTVETENPDITSYNLIGSGTGKVTDWVATYTTATGGNGNAQANGVTVKSLTATTSGTNPFVVDSTAEVTASSEATLGHYRLWVNNAPTEGNTGTYIVVNVTEGPNTPTTGVTVYRLLNPFTGAHLITADVNEWETLSDIGWNDEGVAFYAAETGIDVYRLLNPNNGDHLYTTSLNEYNTLPGDGWVQEGVAFKGSTTSLYPVYRLWNQQQTADGGLGSHLWTADFNEYVELPKIAPNAWTQEGVAWFAYALAPGTN